MAGRIVYSVLGRFLVLALAVSLAIVNSAQAGTTAAGFFDSYLVLGPYNNNPGGGAPGLARIRSDRLCDGITNENTIIPTDGMVLGIPDIAGCAEPTSGWVSTAQAIPTIQTLAISNTTLRLQDLLAPNTNVMAYAWVYVNNVTPDPLRVTLSIASDDSIQAKVNRAETLIRNIGRGFGGEGTTQDSSLAFLLPGWNLIQFKVFQGTGGWGMRARLEDPVTCSPLVSGAGQIIVDTILPPGSSLPPALPAGSATRSITVSNPSPDITRADVAVTVDAGGLPYMVVEILPSGWTLGTHTPGGILKDNPKNPSALATLTWTNLTLPGVNYTLTRTGRFRAIDSERRITGAIGIDDNVAYPTTGTELIGGSLAAPVAVNEILLTPALNQVAVPPGGTCNPPEAVLEGPWMDDAFSFNDETFVPAEGLEFRPDFGFFSQATGFHAGISVAAQGRFWSIPGDPVNTLGRMARIASTNSAGRYDFQNANIYGAIDNAVCAAYFFAINPEAQPIVRRLGIGSDDSFALRVNGRLERSRSICRGNTDFSDKIPIVLDPGKNLIAIYTFEGTGSFQMSVRLEDINGNQIINDATTDPTGYRHDPDGSLGVHPIRGKLGVREILLTPAMAQGQGANPGTDAFTHGPFLADGAGIDDATVVPFDGMEFLPAFGTLSNATGWASTNINAVQLAVFLANPADLLTTTGKLVRVTSSDGFFDLRRADIYGGDANNSTCAAFFYAINRSAAVRFVTMGYGSDDSGSLRVNGRPVIRTRCCNNNFGNKVRIALDPGKNLIASYTFQGGGGYYTNFRFEDDNGMPIGIETTIDPTGYEPDPDGSLGKHPIHVVPPAPPPPPLPICTDLGFITRFLVPAAPLDQFRTSNTISGAVPEDYITIDGQPPSAATVRANAVVQAGSTGQITTAVRGAGICGTYLVPFQGSGTDPGLFNGELFYNNQDQYSSSLFFFVRNKTASDRSALIGFASDDAATLFVNGNRVLEHLAGRGFGGANTIQTGPMEVTFSPGINLVQLSYNEGGGGSGARVALWADPCRTPIDPDELEVTLDANPPAQLPPCISLLCAPRDEDAFRELTYTPAVRVVSYVPPPPSIGTATYSLVRAPAGALINSATGDITYAIPAASPAGTVLDFEVRAALGAQSETASWSARLVDSVSLDFLSDADLDGFDFFPGDNTAQRLNEIEFLTIGGSLNGFLPGPSNPNFDGWCGFDRVPRLRHKIRAFSTFDVETRIAFDPLQLPLTDQYHVGLALDGGLQELNILGLIRHDVQLERNCNKQGDNSTAFFQDQFGLPGTEQNAATLRIERRGLVTRYLARRDDAQPFTLLKEITDCRPWPEGVGLALKSWGNQGNVVTLFDYFKYGSVQECPTAGDTHATALTVTGPASGPGTYNFNATANDESADRIQYTFTADDGSGGPPEMTRGPQTSNTASFTLGTGNWRVCVIVDDDPNCPDAAPDNQRCVDVTIQAQGGFLRGDVDANGAIEITDPINLLGFLFLGEAEPPCLDSADADDNGSLEITDAIVSLGFQFLGEAPPQPPFPKCGPDPGPPDGLSCASYSQANCPP